MFQCKGCFRLAILRYMTTSVVFLFFLVSIWVLGRLQIGDLAIPDHLLAVAADKRYTDCTGPYLLCCKHQCRCKCTYIFAILCFITPIFLYIFVLHLLHLTISSLPQTPVPMQMQMIFLYFSFVHFFCIFTDCRKQLQMQMMPCRAFRRFSHLILHARLSSS